MKQYNKQLSRASLFDPIEMQNPETGEIEGMPLLVLILSLLMAVIAHGGEAGIFCNRETGSFLNLPKIRDMLCSYCGLDLQLSDLTSMLLVLERSKKISSHEVNGTKFYKIITDDGFDYSHIYDLSNIL